MSLAPLTSTTTGVATLAQGASRSARGERVERIAEGEAALLRRQPGAFTRHAFARFEADGRWADDTGSRPVARTATQPRGPFLAQYIAQEQLGAGLAVETAPDASGAYRRAELPLVAIRSGVTVDIAA